MTITLSKWKGFSFARIGTPKLKSLKGSTVLGFYDFLRRYGSHGTAFGIWLQTKCYENEIYRQAKNKISPCITCYDNCLCNNCNNNQGSS